MTPRAVIKNALAFQGAWYVWGGKGYTSWSPDGLKKTEYAEPVFDCSGLVTMAIKQAGGPDWVATHNARRLMESCPTVDEMKFGGAPAAGSLCFYGSIVDENGVKTTKVHHVTLSIGGGYMIEAAGGDRTTTSVAVAKQQNARVRVSEFRTSGFLGARLLP